MKKLIVAGTIVAALAFPFASQAADINAFGVQLPYGQSAAPDNVKGGYVPKGLNDTFHVQTLSGDSEAAPSDEEVYENVYTVFGIRVSGSDVI
ncbi:MAG: hypothetical protein AB1598_05495 [Thermodesulfobacteriota bacterium]